MLLVGLAAHLGLNSWSQHISQVYRQGADRIHGDNYVIPLGEFLFQNVQLFQTIGSLCNFTEDGYYSRGPFSRLLTKNLRMTTTTSDFSRFYNITNREVTGHFATHVDETLGTGAYSFVDQTSIIERLSPEKEELVTRFVLLAFT